MFRNIHRLIPTVASRHAVVAKHVTSSTLIPVVFHQQNVVKNIQSMTQNQRYKSTQKFVPEEGPSGEKVAENKMDKIKALMKDYGPIAAVIYACLSTAIVFGAYFAMKAFGVDAQLLEQKYRDARTKLGYPVAVKPPSDEPKQESIFVRYLGLDPVAFGVAFVITTPLFPLELAATVYLAKKFRGPIKPLVPKRKL
jgi:hypothetical protein